MASVDLRIKRAAQRSRERWDQYAEMTAQFNAESDEAEWSIGQQSLQSLKLLLERHDLEELRELLNDEIFNMLRRVEVVLGVHGRITDQQRRSFVKYLHMLTFDDTYMDYESGSKNVRSKKRIEALIELCHGDEGHFLREYARALEKFFPVQTWSTHYVWKPRLFQKKLESGKIRISLKHHMGVRKEPRLELRRDLI